MQSCVGCIEGLLSLRALVFFGGRMRIVFFIFFQVFFFGVFLHCYGELTLSQCFLLKVFDFALGNLSRHIFQSYCLYDYEGDIIT